MLNIWTKILTRYKSQAYNDNNHATIFWEKTLTLSKSYNLSRQVIGVVNYKLHVYVHIIYTYIKLQKCWIQCPPEIYDGRKSIWDVHAEVNVEMWNFLFLPIAQGNFYIFFYDCRVNYISFFQNKNIYIHIIFSKVNECPCMQPDPPVRT